MDDKAIIALFNERSQDAIKELSQKYSKLSLHLSGNILGSSLDSEECVNDSLLAVWNNIPPENPENLKTYFLKIVRNLSIKKYHSNKALKRNSCYDIALDELENILASDNQPDSEYSLKELAHAINTFLGTLTKENRVFFVRRYYFADSVKEIAALTGNTPHFVSVRLSRTREKLKEYLRKEGLL